MANNTTTHLNSNTMSEIIKTYIQNEAENIFKESGHMTREEVIQETISSGIELAKELIMNMLGWNEQAAKSYIESFLNQKK